MTADEQRKYDEMFNTLDTEGWKYIIERLQETYEAQDNVVNMDTWENTCRAQGRLITLYQLINFRDILKEEVRMGESSNEEDFANPLEA